MSPLTLALLGSPEVQGGGRSLVFRTRKAQALLIYLLVDGGAHARERLADLFWPEAGARQSRMMLRTTLSHLRQALDACAEAGDAAPCLVTQGDIVSLQLPPSTVVDLHRVSAAVQALSARGAARDSATRQQLVAQLRDAAGCYRGEFLAGFSVERAPHFDNWVSEQQEYWHRQKSTVLGGLSRLLAEGGEFHEALEVATRWTTHDPWSDAAQQRLMELHLAMGNAVEARRVYERYCRALADELHATPSRTLTALAGRLELTEQAVAPFARAATPSTAVPGADELAAYLPLAGRSEQFAALVTAYNAARRGTPQAAILTGPAGIGKTRLATEFLTWAAAEGGDVLRGRALEARAGLPYHPLTDALRDRLEQVNAPEDLLDDVWLGELVRLFPELRVRYEDLPAPIADEATARSRLFEAMARLVHALAAQAGREGRGALVLFIDDIQNADATSLDLLLYAAQRWSDARTPLLLLLALRQDAAPAAGLRVHPGPVVTWLPGLSRVLPLTRLMLPALDSSQVVQLIKGLTGQAEPHAHADEMRLQTTGEWLFSETAGQPFFLVETLKLLLEHGLLVPQLSAAGKWTFDLGPAAEAIRGQALDLELPLSVREMILARLAPLSLSGVEVLAAAAVLGDPLDFDLARQVADVSEGAALVALDDILGRGLLRTAVGKYAFSHDSVREVVYEEAGEARRQLYHRRALAALAGSAPPATLARHALAAELKQSALTYYLAAGDEALRVYATRDAAAYYETALRLLESGSVSMADRSSTLPPPTEDDLQRLYLHLGRVYELLEDWSKAETVYRAMVDLGTRDAQPVLAWPGLNALARLCVWSGFRLGEAEDLLQQSWVVAESSDDKLGMAETAWNRAQIGMYTYRATAAEDGELALTLARELNAPELIARCLNVLAHVQTDHGRWGQALQSATEAARRYSEMGDWAMEADCLGLLALAQSNFGRLHEAWEVVRRAQARAAQVSTRWAGAFTGAVTAIVLGELGRYSEALTAGQDAVRLADELAFAPLVRLSHLGLASVELVTGAVDAAYADLQIAWRTDQAAGTGSPVRQLLASTLCAACAFRGDWETAVEFARLDAGAPEPSTTITAAAPLFLEIEALLRDGNTVLAEAYLERTQIQPDDGPRRRLAYLRARAVLYRHRGGLEEAVLDLAEAHHLASTMGLRGEEWQILADLAALHGAIGNRRDQAAARERSVDMVRTLASSIQDQGLRAGFITFANAYPRWVHE